MNVIGKNFFPETEQVRGVSVIRDSLHGNFMGTFYGNYINCAVAGPARLQRLDDVNIGSDVHAG